MEVHSLDKFDEGDIPYNKSPSQCLDEFDNFVVKQQNFNMQISDQLKYNARVIEKLSDVLVRISNDVKGLCKHFSVVHTQLEQVSKSQQDLFRDMLKQHNKHAYGVDTRGGRSTQDPLYPEGYPKRIEQDSQMINDSAPSSPKKKKNRNKTVHASSEPVIEKPIENPNNVSISDAETQSGNKHQPIKDDVNDDRIVDDAPPNDNNETDKEVEVEPEVELDDPPPKNKRYDKRDYVARKHGKEREPCVQKPMPFPSKASKSKDEDAFNRFVELLRPLFFQVPLTDAMKMPPYAKYMKYTVTNKRKIPEAEISTMLANYSFKGKIPEKLGDPGIPTIPCSIRNNYVKTALCDLGANFSVMPFSLYKRLDLSKLIPSEISLQMADKSTSILVGVCEDVPVVVANVTILTDFVILDMPEDDNMSVILGRPFLNTAGVVINCNKSKVTFHVNGNEHTVYFSRKPNKVNSLNSIKKILETLNFLFRFQKKKYQTIMIGTMPIKVEVT